MADQFPRVSVGAFLTGSTVGKHAAHHAMLCEREALKITACFTHHNPDGLKRAMAEVERRERLFADIAATVPHRVEHPRLAALKSVARDAATGSLG